MIASPWPLSIRSFLVCVFIGLALGCEDISQHSVASGEQPRAIVNGTPTHYESWKGVLGIWATTSGTVCTGTLIHPRVILTGGHCVLKNTGSIRFNFQKNPGALRIYGGEDISVWNGVQPIEYPRVQKAVPHPEWKGSLHSADLALLLLEDSIDASEALPFALRQAEASVGEEAFLVGYGRIRADDNTSDGRPHEAAAEIVSISTRFGEGPYTVIKTGKTDAATCSGDSGGPLFTRQKDEWVVTGVASMSDCVSDNLNVNLENHRDWLDETLCELVGQGLPGGACDDQSAEDTERQGDIQSDSALDDGTDTAAGDSETSSEALGRGGQGSGCSVGAMRVQLSRLPAYVLGQILDVALLRLRFSLRARSKSSLIDHALDSNL
jgi:V8-like Glu-specific endopeptidase